MATSLLVLFMSAGCGSGIDGSDTGEPGSDERVGTTKAPLGTVLGTTNQHMNTFGASETAVSALGGNGTLSMAFNAEDPFFLVLYADNTRYIFNGASQMGYTTYNWSTRSIVSSNNIRPPSGWAVLWGDPSIVRNGNSSHSSKIYLANLAIPSSKFPASGQIVGPVDSGGSCGSYIGGACIARSTNDGTSFTLAASDCVQRITTACPQGTFYDGSDMTTSPEGRVYAAFNDVTRSRNDVYMATTPTGAFSRITDLPIASGMHPRLKYGPDGLYLLFQTSGGSLTLARYNGGSSYTGTWTNVTVPGSSGVFNGGADVQLSDRSIRLGPEYDFDIGLGDSGENQIRIVYVLRNASGKHYIKAVRCSTGTITCAEPGAWNTASTSGDQWGPGIAFGFHVSTGKVAWYLSYYSRQTSPTGNQVRLWSAEIRNPPGLSEMSTSALEGSQVPCPDLRPSGGGYWGDYDRMRGTIGMMWRGFSDSAHGTCTRKMFTSTPLYPSLSMWSIN